LIISAFWKSSGCLITVTIDKDRHLAALLIIRKKLGLSRIQNICHLKYLKDLQLGNNKIETIGESLNGNTNLEELNIAGNRLSSFRDILFLSSLPKLTSLCLSDPNFADNPLCLLCNYQTHVIYHIPNLKSLDTLEVTDESRRIISATVLKKRMYYNMRIRTIKRNTNFLRKILENRTREIGLMIETDAIKLIERAKRIQRRKDDLGLPDGDIEKVIEVNSMNYILIDD
jgi:Leucine-rich repeat (LRR) protein